MPEGNQEDINSKGQVGTKNTKPEVSTRSLSGGLCGSVDGDEVLRYVQTVREVLSSFVPQLKQRECTTSYFDSSILQFFLRGWMAELLPESLLHRDSFLLDLCHTHLESCAS